MDEDIKARFVRCAEAYVLYAHRGMRLCEIARHFGVDTDAANRMIEAGRLSGGHVVADFDDETPIRFVPLPPDVVRMLLRTGVKTVGDARRLSDCALRKNERAGRKAIMILREVLRTKCAVLTSDNPDIEASFIN